MVGEKLVPAYIDRMLGHDGYAGEQTSTPADPDRPNNLWEPAPGAFGAHEPFLASPTHAIPAESYKVQTQTYCWKELYGQKFLYGGPLFIHQLSHMWIDFRGIQDDFMREEGIDYLENSRRTTYAQQHYAISNPLDHKGAYLVTSGGQHNASSANWRSLSAFASMLLIE